MAVLDALNWPVLKCPRLAGFEVSPEGFASGRFDTGFRRQMLLPAAESGIHHSMAFFVEPTSWPLLKRSATSLERVGPTARSSGGKTTAARDIANDAVERRLVAYSSAV